ncbi:MAG: hypothetical protein ABJE95_26655 [Byssovorax sp.]
MALSARERIARAAPMAAIVVAACGLAGPGEGQLAVPSDGVGAFGSSAPIELCLGSARVVSPSAIPSAGAVCVAQGSKGNACTSDLGCAGIERCVCGRCVVEACLGGTACGEGRVCRDKRCTTVCAADAGCAAGERCVSGGCARACTSDAGCHFGERCDDLDGTCVTQICSAQIGCSSNDSCEAEQVAGELHEPEVVTIDGASVAFVEIRGGGPGAGSAVYRARIEGRRWTADPLTPVLAPASGESLGAPSAIVRADRVELFFAAGGAIGRAISTDGGRSFTRDAAPTLTAASAWEKGFVGSPAAVDRDGATLLFYEGGPRAGVGLARVDAAGHAVRALDHAVITAAEVEDPGAWRAVSEVGAPYAVVVGDAVRVYFTARGIEGLDASAGDASLPADANDSIGLFSTRDLVHFEAHPGGPVFARVVNLRAYLGEREAAVRVPIAGEGAAEIVFVAADASGASVSGLARAPE